MSTLHEKLRFLLKMVISQLAFSLSVRLYFEFEPTSRRFLTSWILFLFTIQVCLLCFLNGYELHHEVVQRDSFWAFAFTLNLWCGLEWEVQFHPFNSVMHLQSAPTLAFPVSNIAFQNSKILICLQLLAHNVSLLWWCRVLKGIAGHKFFWNFSLSVSMGERRKTRKLIRHVLSPLHRKALFSLSTFFFFLSQLAYNSGSRIISSEDSFTSLPCILVRCTTRLVTITGAFLSGPTSNLFSSLFIVLFVMSTWRVLCRKKDVLKFFLVSW